MCEYVTIPDKRDLQMWLRKGPWDGEIKLEYYINNVSPV